MSSLPLPFAGSPVRSLLESLDAIDSAGPGALRVEVAAGLLHEMGFDRVVIALRDASMNATLVCSAGSPEASTVTGHGLEPMPGAVWRRRLLQLERFRVGDLYLLDGSDPWVAREFFGVEPALAGDGHEWLATDVLIGLLRGAEQEILGTIKIAGPQDGLRPSEARRRDISELTRHLAARLAYDALRGLAEQRHGRLQLLQEAGATLTRSLDEHEIMRELTRQVSRAVSAEGIAILVPNLDADSLVTALRTVRGAERPRGPVRLGDGLVAEVARSGHPVRVGDRDADRMREKSGMAPPLSMYDIVGETESATSVLAVPMRVGIRLVAVLAVHSSAADVYTAEDEEVLATMASQAATAIANARRYAESERERRTTEALADVARAVGESLRLGEVLRLILRHAVSLLGVEGACVALRHDDYLHIVAALGAADVLAGVHLPVGSSLLGRVVLSNDGVVMNDPTDDPAGNWAIQQLAPIQRAVIAPLITGRGTIGSITVINRERLFDQTDLKVLQRLADQVAVAIVNARLFEEVEKATREWKVAFDSTANGMVVLEESLTVSRCNTRAAELCGVSIAELLGRRFRDVLVGAEDSVEARAVDRVIDRALRAGVPTREIVRDFPTGRLFSLLAAPHPDGGCVITFDDVTETHRVTERYRIVLDTVSDAIVITGLDGRMTFANPAAHILFQRPNLVGELVATVTVDEWLTAVTTHEREAQRGVGQHYECEVLRADGERRRVEVTSEPLFELGQITGTVACLRDVTEQRADAVARHRSESMYERLVESAHDAIFTLDVAGCYTSANPGLLGTTGLTRTQLIGRYFAVLVDPIDHAVAGDVFERTLRGERCGVPVRFLGAGGVSRLGMVTSAPIHENGVVVGVLGIVRDITNEEVTRETNAQQARMAAVGQVLGRVANELNNPLGSLLAVADLQIASPTLSQDDRVAMEQIRHEAERASRIVAQLLDTARGGHAPHEDTRAFDLNTFVRRTLELHGYGLRAHGIAVEIHCAKQLPLVAGDPGQLQQALANLLVNAEQALGERPSNRRMTITTREEGESVVVDVTDNGPGIHPNHVPRIFDPMFTTREARGHRGLGLAISQAIVREHGGSIEATSTPGVGATFTVRVPRAVGRITPAIGIPRIESRDAARRVLLIEDEPTLRSAITRFLRGTGCEVVAVPGGAEALAVLDTAGFDVILLDLRMQGMSGETVYERIAGQYPEQSQHVLFMTGDLHSAAASQFIRRTGRPVLAKPFTLQELEAKIGQLLQEPR